MSTKKFSGRSELRSESGQVMIFVVLGLGLFMIGAMAFAIDLSNLWFNRQAAQTAADANRRKNGSIESSFIVWS